MKSENQFLLLKGTLSAIQDGILHLSEPSERQNKEF